MISTLTACSLIFASSAVCLYVKNSESEIIECDFGKVRIKHQPNWPPYPEDWPPLKCRSVAVLAVTVGEDGVPISVSGLDGPADSTRYAQLHLSNWRFFPVELNGKPKKFRFKITVPVPVQPKKS